MCELLTKNIEIADEVDTEKLREMIPDIKQVMFMRANQIQKKLTAIFLNVELLLELFPTLLVRRCRDLLRKLKMGH